MSTFLPLVVAPDPEGDPDCQSVFTDVKDGFNAEVAGRICDPAYAQLFAAAPALLDALSNCIGVFDSIIAAAAYQPESDIIDAVLQARTARAKITG